MNKMAKIAALEVGQEVAIADGWGRGMSYYFGYTVHKITPTGQVTVFHKSGSKKRFSSDGWEIGGTSNRWHRDWLEPDVQAARKLEKERRENAASLRILGEIADLRMMSSGSGREDIMKRIEFIKGKIEEASRILDGDDGNA